MKLHIGGQEPNSDWKIFNIIPGDHVDFVGNCRDLGQFDTDSIDEIYISHVLEHLSHRNELIEALRELYRVLVPGGTIYISVPDFLAQCQAYCAPDMTIGDRLKLARVVFGGQRDAYDLHKFGFSEDVLGQILQEIGFRQVRRVKGFYMFNDASMGKIDPRRPDGSICAAIDSIDFSINLIVRK